MEIENNAILNIIFDMNTNQLLITKKIAYFYLICITKLNKSMNFFINYLCIVYGIQLQFFYHDLPNWYIPKTGNMFLSYKSYLIQITDFFFLIQSLIIDCKSIFVSPILVSIDFFSFKNLRNYIYKKTFFFTRIFSLILQTFVFQVDEDGEEILTKIKETDLFRKQRPGKKSFFENQKNYNGDYKFLHIHFIKNKLFFFIRIFALLIFPYILYQTTRKLYCQSNEPKLAYILEKSNKNQIQLDNHFWTNFLIEDNINESLILQHNLLDFQSNKLCKSRFSTQLRIKDLWNIYKKNNQFNNITMNINLFNPKIDCFLHHLNDVNIKSNLLDKINFPFVCETKNSLLIHKCAFLLIQPRIDNYYFINQNNNLFFEKKINVDLLQSIFNKLKNISYLQNQYFLIHTNYFKFSIINFQFYIQKVFLNINKLERILDKMIYHQLFLNKKKYNFLFKNNTKDTYSDPDLSIITILYSNQFINFIETYVKKTLDTKKNLILECLHKYWHFNYINSINSTIKIFDFNNLVEKNVIILNPNNFTINLPSNSWSEFSKKNRDTIVYVPILKVLDDIHSDPKYTDLFFPNIIKHKKILNFLPLYYYNFINSIYISKQNINYNWINQYLSNESTLKHEIYNLFIKEQTYNLNILYSLFTKNIKKSLDQVYETKKIFFAKAKNINEKYFVKKRDTKHFSYNEISKSIVNQYKIHEIYSLNTIGFWRTLTNYYEQNFWFNSFSEVKKTLDISISNRLINITQTKPILFNQNSKLPFVLYFKNQINLLYKYSSWLFTKEWWLLMINSYKKIFFILYQNTVNYIELHFIDKISFQDVSQNIYQKNILNILQYTQFYLNFFLKKIIYTIMNCQVLLPRENIIYVHSVKLNIFSYISSIISFVSYYWFSLFLGGASFVLWIFFEKIKYLTYPSWNTELNLLVLLNRHKNKNFILTSLDNKKNLLKEQYNLSLQKWSVWIRLFFSKKIGIFLESMWLETLSSDLYTDQRNLGLKLIIPEVCSSNYTLFDLDKNSYVNNNYMSFTQEGLVYLNKLINTSLQWNKQNNKSIYKQKWISFSFYKNKNSLLDISQLHDLKFKKKNDLPISLDLSNLYSRAILLIGPQDTGKSYVVKSIAADAHLPIVYLSIYQLIDVIEFEDTALESDNSLYFLRENILKYYTISSFINTMNTCIVWIPNIETIHYPHNIISKTKEQCTILILRLILKDITQKLVTHQNLLFFASCEDTSYLDPGFISTKRFDRLINLRIPNELRRPQIFINFLKKKKINIQSKNNSWDVEFSNSTMGFNFRDLSYFANQAFLTNLQVNSEIFDITNLRLVLYREMRAKNNFVLDNTFQKNSDILQYQIGRTIVQTTLVRPNPMIPIQSKYNIWKPRFYYLSKVYLQPNYLKSTVTELSILPHILSSLAGLAAIDAYYLVGKNQINENLLSLSGELNHDLDIAVNLFESLFKEFSYSDIFIFKNKLFNSIPQFRPQLSLVNIEYANDILIKKIINQKKSNFNDLNQFSFSQEPISNKIFDISWSIKIERLSLSRNIIFNLLRRIDESLSIFSMQRYFNNISYPNLRFEKEKPYSSIYHRSWDILKPLVPKDLDYYFYSMLIKQRISIMGLPIFSDKLLEYEPPENDLVFIQNRPVWNPKNNFLRNLIFRQRNLFASEELLSILYLLYEAQQTRSSIYKITKRKTIWNPDMYLEKIAMHNQVPKKSVNMIEGMYNFLFFKNLAHKNAIFQRPQPEAPHNSEMAFIKRFIASNRFSRFSLTEDHFYEKNQFNTNNQKLQELLTYGSILESYYYLIKFFLNNQHLFEKIKKQLFEKNILFKEDLQNIIYRSL